MKEREKLTDVLDRIENHASQIYVKDKKKGVPGIYCLTELPTEQALKHVLRWIREAL